ncbi:MAG TPA: DNA recombination protein RmuC [Acidobacteriaceae bacterium]|nr:DNA recombination protein RmuC [Acidobacteriaceae bacterium]
MSSPFCIAVAVLALVAGYAISFFSNRRKLQEFKTTGRLEVSAELGPKISALEAQLDASKSESKRLIQDNEEHTEECRRLNGELNSAGTNLARVEAELEAAKDAARKRVEDEGAMADRFAALARSALSENSTSFIETAKKSFEVEQQAARGALQAKHSAFLDTLQPIQEKIARLDQSVGRLSEDKDRLANEAKNLSSALRKSEIRGRWGEIHLERVAELAGMKNRCDFTLQQTFIGEEKERRRPDMIVNLPLGRYVVVDSKAVMEAYISACATEDPILYAACIAQHAKHIRAKIDELAKVDYAKVLEKDGKNVADMVVCYIPGEAFFSAAVAHDPLLLEHAAKNRVFLASPTILITLLRAIALGWRDHELSQNAEEIRTLGRELYGRLATMKEHFDKLGGHIEKTVTSYNSMVSSLNRKVFPQARRFQMLGATEVGAKPMADSDNVEQAVNDHASADWRFVLPIAASADEEALFSDAGVDSSHPEP